MASSEERSQEKKSLIELLREHILVRKVKYLEFILNNNLKLDCIKWSRIAQKKILESDFCIGQDH